MSAEVLRLEGLLAAHWEFGTVAGDPVHWECVCGYPLGDGTGDLDQRHRAHVAQQIGDSP